MDMASKTRFRPDFFSYVRCWYVPGPNQPLLCTTHGLERAQLEKVVVLGRRQRGNAPWWLSFCKRVMPFSNAAENSDLRCDFDVNLIVRCDFSSADWFGADQYVDRLPVGDDPKVTRRHPIFQVRHVPAHVRS